LGQDNYRWRGGKVCKAQPVRAEIIDELVWQTTKRLISSPELVIKEYANRVDKRKNEADSREQILNKKKLELGCAEREKERMLDLYQFGKLELNEIEHRLKNIRTKIQNIHQEIDFLKHEEEIDSQRLQLVQRFEDFCSTLTINLEKLSFAERNKIIRLLVTDVIIDTLNGEITVNHILPLDQKMCPLGSRTHVNFLSFGCKFRYLVRWSFLKNRLYLTYKLFLPKNRPGSNLDNSIWP
jgi:site-specific DNA recombinase